MSAAGELAFYVYVVPFLISTSVGAFIAGIIVFSLEKSGMLNRMKNSL